MASKEIQHVSVTTLSGAVEAIFPRALQGWVLTGLTLTFERPVVVEVTARPPESSDGHTLKG
jgi:hypothetical protein